MNEIHKLGDDMRNDEDEVTGNRPFTDLRCGISNQDNDPISDGSLDTYVVIVK